MEGILPNPSLLEHPLNKNFLIPLAQGPGLGVCGEWMPPLLFRSPYTHQQRLPTKPHLEHNLVDLTPGCNQL